MILSLFNHIVPLVPLMLSPLFLARPPSYSSLKVNNRSFHHASPRLWSELPTELHQPVDDESLSLSSHLSLTGSSLSPSSSPVLQFASLHLCSTADSKLMFSINPSHHSLPHLFGQISQIFMIISGLNCSSVFLLFCSFHLFCLICVID